MTKNRSIDKTEWDDAKKTFAAIILTFIAIGGGMLVLDLLVR